MRSQVIIFQTFVLFMVLALISAGVYQTVIMPSNTPKVLLNGVKLEHSGLVLQKNMMYIPASFVTDILGASFKVAEAKQETDRSEASINTVRSDLSDVLLNGKLVSFSTMIKASGNQPALYPLREVSNELGIFVRWDAATKTVTIVQ